MASLVSYETIRGKQVYDLSINRQHCPEPPVTPLVALLGIFQCHPVRINVRLCLQVIHILCFKGVPMGNNRLKAIAITLLGGGINEYTPLLTAHILTQPT